jgi:hypothetical protein
MDTGWTLDRQGEQVEPGLVGWLLLAGRVGWLAVASCVVATGDKIHRQNV